MLIWTFNGVIAMNSNSQSTRLLAWSSKLILLALLYSIIKAGRFVVEYRIHIEKQIFEYISFILSRYDKEHSFKRHPKRWHNLVWSRRPHSFVPDRVILGKLWPKQSARKNGNGELSSGDWAKILTHPARPHTTPWNRAERVRVQDKMRTIMTYKRI